MPRVEQRAASPYGTPAAPGGQPEWERYSLEQETYRQERAYDRERTRRRKRHGILRALLTVILVPIVLIIAFVASYALTCILNGASPDEVVTLLGALWERIVGWVSTGSLPF